MMTTMKRGLISISIAGALSACAELPRNSAAPAQYPQYPVSGSYAQFGVVDRIELIRKGASSNLAGTVIGGVVGGLIGAQIGSGSGRTAATIAGAAGGAIAGNAIEGRVRGDNETFRVTVRLDDGSYRTIVQDDLHDLRTGDRVRIQEGRVVRG